MFRLSFIAWWFYKLVSLLCHLCKLSIHILRTYLLSATCFFLQGDLRIVAVLQHLETKIAFKAGKGEKSRSIFEIFDDIPEDDIAQKLKTKPGDCPKLVMFTKDDLVEKSFLCGDGVETKLHQNMGKVMLIAIGAYYVSDLEYPRIYCQLLGFLQQTVLGQAYTAQKTKAFVDALTLLD